MGIPPSDQPVPLLWITSLPYGESDGTPLLLNIICPYPMPATPRPAVIWVHGGGWTTGDRWDGHNDYFCPLLAQHSFFYRDDRLSLVATRTLPSPAP